MGWRARCGRDVRGQRQVFLNAGSRGIFGRCFSTPLKIFVRPFQPTRLAGITHSQKIFNFLMPTLGEIKPPFAGTSFDDYVHRSVEPPLPSPFPPLAKSQNNVSPILHSPGPSYLSPHAAQQPAGGGLSAATRQPASQCRKPTPEGHS